MSFVVCIFLHLVSRSAALRKTEAKTDMVVDTVDANGLIEMNTSKEYCSRVLCKAFPNDCKYDSCKGCGRCKYDPSVLPSRTGICDTRVLCKSFPDDCRWSSCKGCDACKQRQTMAAMDGAVPGGAGGRATQDCGVPLSRPESIGRDDHGRVGGWHARQPSAQPMALNSTSFSTVSMAQPGISGVCRGHMWQATGKSLGKGNHGKVYEVVPYPGGESAGFALKEALSRSGEQDLREEMTIMANTNCAGVLNVIDSQPCVHPRQSPLSAAYVMPKAKASLWDWSKTATLSQKTACADKVGTELMAALRCFHSGGAGYMHGDLKGDNVFYMDIDSDGCPVGVKLADFGLSYKIGDRVPKYESVWHRRSGHLPAVMFQSAPQTPSAVSATYSHFEAHALIDWCSFLYLMSNDFGSDFQTAAGFQALGLTAGQRIECGKMGGHRLEGFQLQGC